MKRWTFDDIPDQTGRTVVVTGANSGIGFETARMLALKGARVALACRSAERADAAVRRIAAENPRGTAVAAVLDLADLQSVSRFATHFGSSHPSLDLLVNNAGVMIPPLSRTAQGFECQFGTNHLGHFALTGHLLPLLMAARDARVVVVASLVQQVGRIEFDDLNWQRRRYRAFAAYAQSKLANMMFALELGRRLVSMCARVQVTAAHPGWTATDLQRTFGLARLFNPIFAMRPRDGALPTLRAAADASAEPGSYWGPSGLLEIVGAPRVARIPARATDKAVAAKLFDISEELTGVSFPRAAAVTTDTT